MKHRTIAIAAAVFAFSFATSSHGQNQSSSLPGSATGLTSAALQFLPVSWLDASGKFVGRDYRSDVLTKIDGHYFSLPVGQLRETPDWSIKYYWRAYLDKERYFTSDDCTGNGSVTADLETSVEVPARVESVSTAYPIHPGDVVLEVLSNHASQIAVNSVLRVYRGGLAQCQPVQGAVYARNIVKTYDLNALFPPPLHLR